MPLILLGVNLFRPGWKIDRRHFTITESLKTLLLKISQPRPVRTMPSLKITATLAVLALTFMAASVDAVGFFSRRRDQRTPKPLERPLSSHFRQRLGTPVSLTVAHSLTPAIVLIDSRAAITTTTRANSNLRKRPTRGTASYPATRTLILTLLLTVTNL